MSEALRRLAARIRDELADLDRVTGRAAGAWQRAGRAADDFYLDSVALNLHSFYAGLERIFELIATLVDGVRPEGENWHQVLLKQVAADVPRVQPAVISETGHERLDEYRGFRHIVRNVYTWRFDPAKVKKLWMVCLKCSRKSVPSCWPLQISWTNEDRRWLRT